MGKYFYLSLIILLIGCDKNPDKVVLDSFENIHASSVYYVVQNEEAKIIETQLISGADNPVGHVFALNSIITQLTWNETKTEYDKLLLYHSRKALDWCEPILEKNREHIP